jgi:hypothetical protein
MNFVCKTSQNIVDENCLESNVLRNKKITYMKSDICIGFCLKHGNYWEKWMSKYIQENYIENTNMMDLGANIGTTTLLMSEVLSNNCKIFSFEPIYSDILFKNIIDNNLSDKVEIYPYGVGNEITTLKIKPINLSDPINFGALDLRCHLEDKEDSCKIDIVPVDHFNFENVSLIKMDVENMEIEVLEGCLHLINRCKPTILIEVGNLDKFKATDIFKELTALGYDFNQIQENAYDGHDYILKIK